MKIYMLFPKQSEQRSLLRARPHAADTVFPPYDLWIKGDSCKLFHIDILTLSST
jgi:hypothetical protein